MSLSTGTRLGGYELLGSLGAGGMSEVYRARDTQGDRELAIKILPELFAADPDRVTYRNPPDRAIQEATRRGTAGPRRR